MAKTFPYLEVSGTHKDVGAAIGGRFKDKIQRRIAWQRRVVKNYEDYLSWGDRYFTATKQAFPNLIDELEAIAKAAEVPVPDLFFVNNRDLFDPSEELLTQRKGDPDRCTIAVAFNKEGPIVGHNEDWPSPVDDFLMDDLYILKATIGETTFLGLEYATEVPGDVANMNNWGLVQCINELMTVSKVGVPKNFVARAVLEAKTLEEAETIISETNRASGFNHVLIQDHEVYNFETADEVFEIEKVEGVPYVHTNHYTAPGMENFEVYHTRNSEARYQRAKELVKDVATEKDMMNLLSDTNDPMYPICRQGITVGSLVFKPVQKEVWICYGAPSSGEFVKYSL